MTRFAVMTWNVENLFPPSDAASQQRYQDKLALLAAVIGRLDPDVVALQEIGGPEPLNDLQRTMGTHPHAAISAFADGRGIRVAFLSKLALVAEPDHIVEFPSGPALEVRTYTDDGCGTEPVRRMGRGGLHIRLKTSDRIVDIITAHLKSKLLTFPRPGPDSFSPRDEAQRAQVAGVALLRRTAEAVTLRLAANRLLENNETTALVLLGDFNDVPEAQTSLILTGPPGSQIGTSGFERPDKGDDARLFNLVYTIEDPDQRYSRIHNGQREMLDQIFASEEMLPRGADGKRRLPLVKSHIDFAQGLPSVSEDPRPRASQIAPDHAPVTANFEL
jgi:endonuclease/exonuclease/phosphatase family metal-dependent hydrolase